MGDRCERRSSKAGEEPPGSGASRRPARGGRRAGPLAVVAVYVGLVALLALIARVVVPALFTQLRAAAERLPALINSAEAHLDGWCIGAGGKLTQAMGRLGSAAMILPLRAMG